MSDFLLATSLGHELTPLDAKCQIGRAGRASPNRTYSGV